MCLWFSKWTAPTSVGKSKVEMCLELYAPTKMADLTKFGKLKCLKSIQLN